MTRILSLASLAALLVACDPVPPGPTGNPNDTDVDTGVGHTDAPSGFDALPAGAWTYLEVDGMECGPGTPTGIGVNPGSDPSRVVFVVQGGGACWDTASCYVLKSAVNVESGWGEARLAGEVAPLDRSPLFDRADTTSPWSTATWVLVPYCTGDLHAGRSERKYDPIDQNRVLHHSGDANMEAVIDRVTEALPDVDQLWAIGFSAGGYGVQFQMDRFVGAYPGAEVALMADGSPMVHPAGGRWGTWRTTWDMRLPEPCEACLTSMPTVLEERAAAAPDARIGLITTRNDSVITLFTAQPLGTLPGRVDKLIADQYVGDDHLQAFVVDGDEHVLSGNLDRVGPGGVRLGDWIAAWRDGTEDWVDVY